ncbi:MAG: ATP-binding protein [Verrucomicrobiota bacterium]
MSAILGRGFLLLLLFPIGAGAQARTEFGRVATSYALTSTRDVYGSHPSAWRLWAAEAENNPWRLLDCRTNESFAGWSQRRVFALSNSSPFVLYRLQIDAVTQTDKSQSSVQLAELELIGRDVAGSNRLALQPLVTASRSHPVVGPPENAFDQDPTTRWVGFGLGEPAGCWIQCQFVVEAGRTATDLRELQTLARGSAAQGWLWASGPRLVANLNLPSNRLTRALTAYALTSANDRPSRDPADWRLLGWRHGETNWVLLDSRQGEVFPERFQRRLFVLPRPVECEKFRLEVTAVHAAGESLQLAEIEALFPAGDEFTYSAVVEASADNPPIESITAAFDGNSTTKWLTFDSADIGSPVWVQWQYVQKEEDLPVIDQRQLDRIRNRDRLARWLDNPPPVVPLQGYALTSANDEPSRDPRDWTLLGSNDAGATWKAVDARAQERFPERRQRRVFRLRQPAVYRSYRLQIRAVADAAHANSVQLAEVEPFYRPALPRQPYSLVVSAQGENPPQETVGRAFDGSSATKWLSYAAGQSDPVSWVQWEISPAQDEPVLELQRLRSAPVRPPAEVELRLKAIVLSWNPDSRRLSLLDETSCEMLELDAGTFSLELGMQIQLEGAVELWRTPPLVRKPRIAVRGQLPGPAQTIDQPGSEFSRCFWLGSTTGKVSAISVQPALTTLRLIDSNGGDLLARILGAERMPFATALDCRLQVRGIVQALLQDQKQQAPGIIWVPGLEAVSLAQPTAAEWETWPVLPLGDLGRTNRAPPQVIRVRGCLLEQRPGLDLVLTDGGHSLRMAWPDMRPWPVGTPLEAGGLLQFISGEPVLRLAWLQPALEDSGLLVKRTDSAGPPASPISDFRRVQEVLRRKGADGTRVRLSGVITYVDPGWGGFYLQDGSEALYIDDLYNAGLSPFLGLEGNYAEVEGEIGDGRVNSRQGVRLLGRAAMPRPAAFSWDYLMSGQDDDRWIQVEGVGRKIQKQRLTLSTAGGQMIVWINDPGQSSQSRWLGSRLRVSGVCSPVLNNRRQRIGVRLLVPYTECVEVIKAAPEDPFDLPTQPLSQVMRAGDEPGATPLQLMKTRGLVTYCDSQMAFLQEGTAGLRLVGRTMLDVSPGDLVEAAGLAEPDGFSPKLVEAVIRKIGRGSLPIAQLLDPVGTEEGRQEVAWDATRGQFQAIFLGHSVEGSVYTLQLQSTKATPSFKAILPAKQDPRVLPLPGSLVRLEGVFKAKTDQLPDFAKAVTSFEVYLNSPTDIRVLARPSWWSLRHAVTVLISLAAVLVLALIWAALLRQRVRQSTRQLRAEIQEHKATEAQLHGQMAQREQMQAQLEKTHEELLVASRRAGMAEVATGVLHNVGNVLNSVNVSTSLLQSQLRQSKAGRLQRAVHLLREHEGNLAQFLERDGRGREVIGYLDQIAERLALEQSTALDELKALAKNLDHLKLIVAAQQGYARVTSVLESVRVGELVEDALRLHESGLARDGIQVRREYAPHLGQITLDKHKLLQVLINLIKNAQAAGRESAQPDKWIRIELSAAATSLKIAISDNGVGIPPENLSRIFRHGFTTFREGHGFGLHSAALAVKEMGGSLRAESAGPNQGATFTIELPLHPKEPASFNSPVAASHAGSDRG